MKLKILALVLKIKAFLSKYGKYIGMAISGIVGVVAVALGLRRKEEPLPAPAAPDLDEQVRAAEEAARSEALTSREAEVAAAKANSQLRAAETLRDEEKTLAARTGMTAEEANALADAVSPRKP